MSILTDQLKMDDSSRKDIRCSRTKRNANTPTCRDDAVGTSSETQQELAKARSTLTGPARKPNTKPVINHIKEKMEHIRHGSVGKKESGKV
ncbi:hypothetical protein GWI33_010557 [Rhynchophorus ferrugineus]|uniref:Uncharacterized protein n=1 Tax=Rhynchophorus ferrugineus TaxID=354439 RepID=A0A834IT17_RHYFE|nr:hypothetical protein GWI33_010557 [Rhynchophorus ferrugineus]